MALVFPNEGENKLCSVFSTGGVSGAFVLFKNNYTPVPGTTWASLTEADYSGYIRQIPVWGAAAQNGSGQAQMTAAPMTFTRGIGGTSNTVYGWAWISTDPMGAIVLAADTLSAPKTMNNPGDGVTITPTVRLYQE